jgi:hypothetical protein
VSEQSSADLPVPTSETIVHDDVLGIDRKVFPDQPVPPDLVEAYEKSQGKGSSAKSERKDAKDEDKSERDQAKAERSAQRDKAQRGPQTDK